MCNSKKIITKREYLKYNQNLQDMQCKPIKPGDTVVINNNYGTKPYIGKVDHFTESGNVAVKVKSNYNNKSYIWYNYRAPSNILVIKKGKIKNK